MEIIFVILALIVGACITFLVLNPEKRRVTQKYDALLNEYHAISVHKGELSSRCEELLKQMTELKDENGEREQRLKSMFENISNKVIDENRAKMDALGAERIKALIVPLGENIEKFKNRVEQVHSEQSKERFSLEKEIKRLVDTNQRISEDATNLTNALKGSNKTQGNWGEMILERILESSGLVCGVEGYELQSMLRDASGSPLRSEDGRKMIPDAVVHFPDNRNVIIDSKVSLVSYLNYCNSDDVEEKNIELKKHISSIKSHIAELDVKSYENYVDGSLDFVMMFIPNESAYVVAMQGEASLWNDAYKKKVLLISPTNLITSLKIVADLWTREKQNKNVEDIIARGEKLYEKCRTFLETLMKIEKGLAVASTAYDDAYKLLVGNGGVVRQAEMLKELGVKSKKELPLKSIETEDE